MTIKVISKSFVKFVVWLMTYKMSRFDPIKVHHDDNRKRKSLN